MIGLFLNGATTLEDVQRFVNTRQPDFFRIQMPGLRSICQRCLEKNMRNRPRAPALIKDGWFSGMALGTAHFYNSSPATQAFGQAYSAPVATYSAPAVGPIYSTRSYCPPPVATPVAYSYAAPMAYSAPAVGPIYPTRSYCPPPVATPVASSYAAPMAYSAPVVSSSYVAPAPGYSTTVPVASSLGTTRGYSATIPVASSLGPTRGYSATIPVAPSYAPAMPYATPRPVTAAYASPMVPSYSMPGKPSLAFPAVIV